MSTITAPPILIAERPSRPWSAWTIILADALALELSLLLGLATRLLLRRWFPIEIGPAQYGGLAFGIPLVLLSYYLMGLYPGFGLNPVEKVRGRVYATFTVFTLLIGWDYLVLNRVWSRGILLATLAFALVLPSLAEFAMRELLRKLGWHGMPVAILGAGDAARRVIRGLRRQQSLGLRPVAAFDPDESRWNTRVEDVPVLGPVEQAHTLAEGVQIAVLALDSLDSRALGRLVNRLQFPQVILVPDLPGLQSTWTVSRDLGGVLGLEMRRNLLLPLNRRLKQLLDYGLGLPLFLLCLPVIAFSALWIKLTSPGSCFFRQVRRGANGRPTSIYKIRTMRADAEQVLEAYLDAHPAERDLWNHSFKLSNDPRVLGPFARFLRRFSLDELPQLWNVLRGELSLVGPRPFPDYHLCSFSPDFLSLRQSVKPGLTGLWQVGARSNADLEEQETCDTYYIRNWSLWLDLYLLFRTVKAVLLPRGAY